MSTNLEANHSQDIGCLPDWFRQGLPDKGKINPVKDIIEKYRLNTVCRSALCPNKGKCWEKGVATFMILGDICTRDCAFCAVIKGTPGEIDKKEPDNIALAVAELKLNYVVITSVTRDDLPDKGSMQFVLTIEALKRKCPNVKVEALIPDFYGESDLLEKIISARADVISHNIEMVKRLYPLIRPKSDYIRSLGVLKDLKRIRKSCLVKTGFMVGLGEAEEEINELIEDLSRTGCDMLTIGQYLSPSFDKHFPVKRFVPPEDFESYKKRALRLGIGIVRSAPLVRSSFLAEEAFLEFKGSQKESVAECN
ncbi:MAG: lipoyl synthase [Candidatus Omnitrophica bacterium]|nr:lipoyl synthase [Candidatus Omnitrophota bacterium]